MEFEHRPQREIERKGAGSEKPPGKRGFEQKDAGNED
jgi:hypothetical protein